MKTTSLEPIFLGKDTDTTLLDQAGKQGLKALRQAVGQADFNTVYDYFRMRAAQEAEAGRIPQAMAAIQAADRLITRKGEQPGHMLNVHAALSQILTALQIEAGQAEEASKTAAYTLELLAQDARRKDQPFLLTLGALLYDIALLHSGQNQFKQAERELEKAARIFERLAKTAPARYAPAHIMTLNAATTAYHSRVRQAELLAHYQAATAVYMQMVNQGIGDATGRLIESLHTEGQTLAQMNRHREAVQYFSRALKYLTKLQPEFTLDQLRLSISLGQSMLHLEPMRDKAVHLFNTMLHKATKIGAEAQHRQIVEILLNAKSRTTDILGFWHKMFPK